MSNLALTTRVSRAPSRFSILWEFLKEELAPYPARTRTVVHMVVAATLVMIICLAFRVPYGFQGAIYAFIVSRDSPRATLESGGTILLVSVIGVAYILISASLVISNPPLHFFWSVFSFFAAFYVLSIISNYGAASIFAIIVAIAIPFWDRHVSAATNVNDTLWVLFSSFIGVVVTAVVELAFARSRPGDDVILPLAERLAAVQRLLACYIDDRPVDQAAEKKITSLVMLGTSSIRRVLLRSDYSTDYIAQMGAVVAFVGSLLDIAVVTTQSSFRSFGEDKARLRDLDAAIAGIRRDLINRQIPHPIQFSVDHKGPDGSPLVHEMMGILVLIPQVFVGSRSMTEYSPSSEDLPPSKLLARDALENPEHLKFALKGGLAATFCYIFYSAVDWPGISTAVTTCLLTGLSTIGTSRQKQILRIAGTIAGGFLFGMGSQIFVLPYLDTVSGFTVLFVFVTTIAAWFMTSSPRLSYFGLQIIVAYYLINLQEFVVQTSLTIARDRVIGTLLGLFMMWLVFDQLWGAPSAVEMKKKFISNLRLLAQFAREPIGGDKARAISRAVSLRTTISTSFDQVRSFGDAVLFEFGPSREHNLSLRSRIIRWQSQLRALFLTRIVLLKYRFSLPGFALPGLVREAQQEFDSRLAGILDTMADRLDGKLPERIDDFNDAFERLEQTVRTCCSEGPQQLLSAELQAFLDRSRNISDITISLSKDL